MPLGREMIDDAVETMSDERLDADRQRCEYLIKWDKYHPQFCDTPATKRYQAMGGGYMHLCDEHSIVHLDYVEDLPHVER